MMQCKCGFTLKDEDVYCSICGRKVKNFEVIPSEIYFFKADSSYEPLNTAEVRVRNTGFKQIEVEFEAPNFITVVPKKLRVDPGKDVVVKLDASPQNIGSGEIYIREVNKDVEKSLKYNVKNLPRFTASILKFSIDKDRSRGVEFDKAKVEIKADDYHFGDKFELSIDREYGKIEEVKKESESKLVLLVKINRNKCLRDAKKYDYYDECILNLELKIPEFKKSFKIPLHVRYTYPPKLELEFSPEGDKYLPENTNWVWEIFKGTRPKLPTIKLTNKGRETLIVKKIEIEYPQDSIISQYFSKNKDFEELSEIGGKDIKPNEWYARRLFDFNFKGKLELDDPRKVIEERVKVVIHSNDPDDPVKEKEIIIHIKPLKSLPVRDIIGVDFGTNASAVIHYIGKSGDYEIINNLGEDSEPLILSDFIIEDWDGDNITVNVKRDAIKDVITKKKEADIEIDMSGVTIYNIENDGALFRFIKKGMGTLEKQKLDFKIKNEEKREYPELIAAQYLKELRTSLNSSLKMEVKDIVISVPTSFTISQRERMKEAFKEAGFNIKGIVDEASAAGFASLNSLYYQGKLTLEDKDVNYIMIVDVGGGTTDVTIFKAQFDKSLDIYKLETVATTGLPDFGGEKITAEIMNNKIISDYSEATKVKVDISDLIREKYPVSKAIFHSYDNNKWDIFRFINICDNDKQIKKFINPQRCEKIRDWLRDKKRLLNERKSNWEAFVEDFIQKTDVKNCNIDLLKESEKKFSDSYKDITDFLMACIVYEVLLPISPDSKFFLDREKYFPLIKAIIKAHMDSLKDLKLELEAIMERRLKVDKIDKIILTGRASRFPIFKYFLGYQFAKSEEDVLEMPNVTDAKLAVAKGVVEMQVVTGGKFVIINMNEPKHWYKLGVKLAENRFKTIFNGWDTEIPKDGFVDYFDILIPVAQLEIYVTKFYGLDKVDKDKDKDKVDKVYSLYKTFNAGGKYTRFKFIVKAEPEFSLEVYGVNNHDEEVKLEELKEKEE